jgi:ACS family hexuronate transporter-like MFS transporter
MSASPWTIATLLALATALNYLDRQTLPVLIGELGKAFPISTEAYGRMQAAFLLSYGVMYALGGRILDRFGTRLGYALFMMVWSGATVIHGFATNVLGLGLARFLLGLGEGGGFPASAKAVAESFPLRQRSLIFGFFNTGSSLGAVIAPPLIALLATRYGWRSVFFLAGSLGFVWLLFWWRAYAATTNDIERTPPSSWIELLAHRHVIGLALAKFFSDAAWYFYIFWLPKYLNDIRGLNTAQVGTYAWIPYAFAGAGSLLGGWASGWLLARRRTLDFSRKAILGFAAILMPTSLFITQSPLSAAIFFFGLSMFGHQCWSSLIQTLTADLFPARNVGSVAGLIGCAGSFGGFAFSLIAGQLIGGLGYGPIFLVTGLLHPFSFLILLRFIPKIEGESV